MSIGLLCAGNAGGFGYNCGYNSASLYPDEEGLHCVGQIFIWGVKDGNLVDATVYLKDGAIDHIVHGDPNAGGCGNISVQVVYQ